MSKETTTSKERRDRDDKFQSFQRPHMRVAKVSEKGRRYVDYKDTETLKKLLSNNGKILSRRRTGISAMEQRMVARAVKRARFMALLPFVTTAV